MSADLKQFDKMFEEERARRMIPDEEERAKFGRNTYGNKPELTETRNKMYNDLNIHNIIVSDMKHLEAPGSFICTGQINESVCDELINYYNALDNLHHPGVTAGGVNVNAKDTTDLQVTHCIHDTRTEKYFIGLNYMLGSYMNCWNKSCITDFNIETDFHCNIQSYKPGAAYFAQHCERDRASLNVVNRILAWMTYLNDVEEGGETFFVIQDVKIKPKKGLTVIWPADWTHTHKGLPAPKETKQIITGWFNLASPANPLSTPGFL